MLFGIVDDRKILLSIEKHISQSTKSCISVNKIIKQSLSNKILSVCNSTKNKIE